MKKSRKPSKIKGLRDFLFNLGLFPLTYQIDLWCLTGGF